MKVTRNFDIGVCVKTLGLEENGRLLQICANEVLRLSDPYIPFAEAGLSSNAIVEDKKSGGTEQHKHLTDIGKTEATNDGVDVVWNSPYANYMWEGIVYEDPDLHCAGFQTENGWRSRKNVQKVPTTRSLEYGNGTLRGAHWADHMLQNGGLEKIQKTLQEELQK